VLVRKSELFNGFEQFWRNASKHIIFGPYSFCPEEQAYCPDWERGGWIA